MGQGHQVIALGFAAWLVQEPLFMRDPIISAPRPQLRVIAERIVLFFRMTTNNIFLYKDSYSLTCPFAVKVIISSSLSSENTVLYGSMNKSLNMFT